MLAAHFMVDMHNSHARDGMSLFEEYRMNGNSNNSSVSSSGGSAGDDTLLVLDRLREVTQKATQLEVS